MPKNFDDIFKKASENAKVPKPDPALWGNLNDGLKAGGYISASSSAFAFLFSKAFLLSSAAAIIISTGLVFWSLSNQDNSTESKNLSNFSSKEIQENTLSNIDETSKSATNKANKEKLGQNDFTSKDELKNSNNKSSQKSINTQNPNSKKNQNINRPNSNKTSNSANFYQTNSTIKQFSGNNGINNNSNNNKTSYNYNAANSNSLNQNYTNSSAVVSNNYSQNYLQNNNSSQNYFSNNKSSNFINNNSNILSNNVLYESESFNYTNQNNIESSRNQIDFLYVEKMNFSEGSKKLEIQNIENQDSTQKYFKSIKSKPNKVQAYIRPYASIDYTFYSNAKDSTISYLSKSSKQLNYTFGLFGGYNVWKNLYVETGILYSSRGRINWNYNNINETNNNAEFNLKSNYLLIPLKLRYNISNHGFTFYTSAGANLKINLSTKNSYYKYTDNENQLEYEISPKAGSLGLDLLVNAGIDWRILPELSFFIEPEFRYSTTSILLVPDYNVLPSNPKQHSFGLGMGLNYKFLKK